MKKYKSLMDFVLLGGLAVISLLAVAPDSLKFMPTNLEVALIAAVLVLLAAFLAFYWREDPSDEREAYNQALASRMAYVIGSIVLITGFIVQVVRHDMDATIPLALFTMLATKLLVQRNKNSS